MGQDAFGTGKPERRSGFVEALSLLLLVSLVVVSVVWTMDEAQWVAGLHSLVPVALAALAIGFLFARSRISGVILHLTALVAGAGIVLWQASLVVSTNDSTSRLWGLFIGMKSWSHSLTSSESAGGLVPFAVFLVGLTWLLGYLSAWMVVRGHRVWWAIVPGGIV